MNVLLVEDHPIFRFGVRQLIQNRWPEAECGEAGTLSEALSALRQKTWHIAVVDLNLPDADGVEVVSQLLRASASLRVLVVSLNAEAAYARRVLQMGASGYLAKDRAREELLTAIERIDSGGRYISASLADHLANLLTGQSKSQPHEELSTQEYRVMLQLAAGKRINDIADGMHLSPKTVSTYRSRVMEKLELASNAELARYCISHGLFEENA